MGLFGLGRDYRKGHAIATLYIMLGNAGKYASRCDCRTTYEEVTACSAIYPTSPFTLIRTYYSSLHCYHIYVHQYSLETLTKSSQSSTIFYYILHHIIRPSFSIAMKSHEKLLVIITVWSLMISCYRSRRVAAASVFSLYKFLHSCASLLVIPYLEYPSSTSEHIYWLAVPVAVAMVIFVNWDRSRHGGIMDLRYSGHALTRSVMVWRLLLARVQRI